MKSRKSAKIIATFSACMLCVSMLGANIVHADEPEIPDADTAIAENYWADLEKNDTVEGEIYPKYLMKPQDTVLKNIPLAVSGTSPSTGTYRDVNTITYVAGFDMFDYISHPELKDNEGPNGDPDYQDGKYHNPFHFNFDTDFIKERDQLNIYGDISVNGNTGKDVKATYKIGDKLNLDFSVNLCNFGKFKNTGFWQSINGHSKGMAWKFQGVDGYKSTDSELVFTLDMPQGIAVPQNAKIDVQGLPNFTVTREDVDGKILIKLRKIQEDKGYMTAKEYFEIINKIDEVKVSITGISIDKSVALDKDLTIKGSLVGVHDDFSTDSKDEAINKNSDNSEYDSRSLFFFVAKQSDAGRDVACDANKPNLISYTFRVSAPVQNTVTFMNGDDTYASVKVDTGKAIDNDSLTDQSMPQNPTKNGHTFKEWNTQKDGKGTAFTGTTVVNKDMTVYAIYSKNAVVINEVPTLEVKDKTIKQGEKLDLMSLVVSAKDKEDGDLTKKVKIVDNGGFDKDKIGKYIVTFKVADKDGASVTKKATVTVIEKLKPAPTPNSKPTPTPKPNNKTTPNTGDSSNLPTYVVLMGLSGVIAMAAAYGKRRKFKK